MEFRDLKRQYKKLKPQIDIAVENVMSNANFISGGEVKQLETELAGYVGVKHCISCGNGTDALVLSLMAWGIGKGDAVFVPDFTFFATGEAPAFLGATPFFVDVDKATFNISPKHLEDTVKYVLECTDYKPKAVIAVDLFGQPADYDEIRKVTDKYNLFLLEDGAQGFGGRIGDKKACSFGDISTTSFFPAKPLGCYGDGGAVFTDNNDWADVMRSYCVHGKGRSKYENVRVGMNSRLDTIQAAVLRVKFKAFKDFELAQVNKVAGWYDEKLYGAVITPKIMDGFYSSRAQYTIICRDVMEREKLQNRLRDEGIPSMVYYAKGMHEQGAFGGQGIVAGCDYEGSMYLKERVLSLPMSPYIEVEELEKIVRIVSLFAREGDL